MKALLNIVFSMVCLFSLISKIDNINNKLIVHTKKISNISI